MPEDFSGLGLSAKVTDAVTAAGYTKPTEIQAQAIPHVLEKKDIIGIAQTGTGKTASFVLPMLTLLESGRARARMPRTLILEPTRELAAQVHENFEKYGKNHQLSVALLIGGVSFDDQNKKLDRGVDVLIATPGRLLDQFERGRILMTGVEILVIDEADRMLDMGFIPEIERICAHAAAAPPDAVLLGDHAARDPAAHQPLPARPDQDRSRAPELDRRDHRPEAGEGLEQARGQARRAAPAHPRRDGADQRDHLLATASATWRPSPARCSATASPPAALHGDMDQKSRTETLDAFKTDKLTLLIASDVAARGLDIPAVSHVFNFDVPTHAEDYIHRIGRTGRAGRSGISITLVAPVGRQISRRHRQADPARHSAIRSMALEAPASSADADADETQAERPRRGRRTRGGERRRDGRRSAEGADARTRGRPRRPAQPRAPKPRAARPRAAQPKRPRPRRHRSPRARAPAAGRAPAAVAERQSAPAPRAEE